LIEIFTAIKCRLKKLAKPDLMGVMFRQRYENVKLFTDLQTTTFEKKSQFVANQQISFHPKNVVLVLCGCNKTTHYLVACL
jgi:hypothetical protein